jgi:hypothetical protein
MGYFLDMHLSAAAPANQDDAPPASLEHSASGQVQLSRYLLVLVLPTLAFMLIAIPWTRYARTAPGKWMMPAMDFRYSLRNVDADVVIFGDSTGLVALDPSVMQPELHLSVVNLSSLGSIFNVQLDDMLEHYLRYNKAPRLIIVSLSPWNLRQEPVTPEDSFEGIVMLVRHGTWPEIFHFMAAHPNVTLHFEFQVLQSLFTSFRHRDPSLHQELVEHRGFAPIDPPALEHPCKLPKPYTDPATPEGLAFHFYKKYSSPQTRVLVYMAPVPDCEGSEQFLRPPPNAAWLVPSAIVPAAEMCEDGMHMEASASASNSHIADEEIEKYLAASGNSLH